VIHDTQRSFYENESFGRPVAGVVAVRAVAARDTHAPVRWFQIAVNDGFLMSVLNAFAHVHKQFQPVAGVEPVTVAVSRDRNIRHVLHHEVRCALRRGGRVEHLGDGGVVHQSQSLALGLEACDHLAAVHAGFD
jgi:hypothetical protein